GLKEGIPAL
nr:Chain C, Peptide G9L [Toxoplasma gondii]